MTAPDRAVVTMEGLRTEAEMRIALHERITELEAEVAKLVQIADLWQEATEAFCRGALMTGDMLAATARAATWDATR
jgi:hypothetical protein